MLHRRLFVLTVAFFLLATGVANGETAPRKPYDVRGGDVPITSPSRMPSKDSA